MTGVVIICLERGANDLNMMDPPDATATPSSLALLKSRMAYLSGAGLPSCPDKRPLNQCSVVVVVVVVRVVTVFLSCTVLET